MAETRRERAPAMESPVEGETNKEALARRQRNRDARERWNRRWNECCAVCGMVRFHVSHEQDPETSPEGPEYHAEFEHHAFVKATP